MNLLLVRQNLVSKRKRNRIDFLSCHFLFPQHFEIILNLSRNPFNFGTTDPFPAAGRNDIFEPACPDPPVDGFHAFKSKQHHYFVRSEDFLIRQPDHIAPQFQLAIHFPVSRLHNQADLQDAENASWILRNYKINLC
jgi:hypothetical protein